MKLNYFLRIVVLISFFSNAQAPVIEWQKALGGTSNDQSFNTIKTMDGGYIMVGHTQSNNGDLIINYGSDDYWIVKLNSFGIIEWQKIFGGTGLDIAHDIKQTSDGGYIVAGYTFSNNLDVSGNHGLSDIWILKLNSLGTLEWQKTIGGTQEDYARSIQKTTDGGFIIYGETNSINGDVTENHGEFDSWVIKLNSLGIIEWQKTLGGTNGDYVHNIKQTTDGGYILAGYTFSNDGDVSGNHGNCDSWIVKLNSFGIIEWQKTLGGTNGDYAFSIIQTIDGGYILTGETESNDGDILVNHGDKDCWIVKLNSFGIIDWEKTLGGTNNDTGYYIKQTIDNGYIIAGFTQSNNGDVTFFNGFQDCWIVKLNTFGVIDWEKTLGGTLIEFAYSIEEITNNEYLVSGFTSSNNGDVIGNHGGNDAWIVKLAPENLSNNSFIENTTITISPNPAKENLTLKLNYFTPSQEIIITDIQGKIIHNQKLEGLSTTINTSSFEKGIYFLNLVDGTQKTTKKFVVE